MKPADLKVFPFCSESRKFKIIRPVYFTKSSLTDKYFLLFANPQKIMGADVEDSLPVGFTRDFIYKLNNKLAVHFVSFGKNPSYKEDPILALWGFIQESYTILCGGDFYK